MGILEVVIPLLLLTSPIWIVLSYIMRKSKAERGYYWYTQKMFQAFWSKFTAIQTTELM